MMALGEAYRVRDEDSVLTVQDFTQAMRRTSPDYSQNEYRDFLIILRETIRRELQDGKEVNLYELGTFTIRQNPDRYSKFTGENILYKGKCTLKFVFSRTFERTVRKVLNARRESK